MILPTLVGLALLILVVLVVAGASASEPELIANPGFAERDAEGMPTHWQPWTPGFGAARAELRLTPEGLLCEAPGKPFAVGGVWQEAVVMPAQASSTAPAATVGALTETAPPGP